MNLTPPMDPNVAPLDVVPRSHGRVIAPELHNSFHCINCLVPKGGIDFPSFSKLFLTKTFLLTA